MYNPNYSFWGPQGWQCPRCGRIYSPSTSMCFYCSNNSSPIVVTDKTIPTKPEKTSAIKEYPADWNEWLSQTTINNNSFLEDYQRFLNHSALNIFDYPDHDKSFSNNITSITYTNMSPDTIEYQYTQDDRWCIN